MTATTAATERKGQETAALVQRYGQIGPAAVAAALAANAKTQRNSGKDTRSGS